MSATMGDVLSILKINRSHPMSEPTRRRAVFPEPEGVSIEHTTSQPTPSDDLRERVRKIIRVYGHEVGGVIDHEYEHPDMEPKSLRDDGEIADAIHEVYKPILALISPTEERTIVVLGDGNFALPTTCPRLDDGEFVPPVSLHFVPMAEPRPVGTECPEIGTHGEELNRDDSVCEIVFKNPEVARLVLEDLTEAFLAVGWDVPRISPTPSLTEEEREAMVIARNHIAGVRLSDSSAEEWDTTALAVISRLLNEGGEK